MRDSRAENAGEMRTFAPGSAESCSLLRIVTYVEPACTGRTKLPRNVAPAWSSITSPGCAASRTACRSPPAATDRVAAEALEAAAHKARAAAVIHPRWVLIAVVGMPRRDMRRAL